MTEQRSHSHQDDQQGEEIERTTPRLPEVAGLSQLLQESDAIIEQRLSENSAEFLGQMRQQGGE